VGIPQDLTPFILIYSNKLAIVKQINHDDITKPKVRSFYCEKLRQLLYSQNIDFTKTEDVIIKDVKAKKFDLDMNEIVNK
jgi:hypothetical protein